MIKVCGESAHALACGTPIGTSDRIYTYIYIDTIYWYELINSYLLYVYLNIYTGAG
jgi:hypothetical protein